MSVSHQPKAGELLTGEEYEALDHHIVDLTAADVGAATADHDHDADYSATGHTHDYEASGAVATHAGAADPHTGYQKESEKGQASGYASLDADTKVPIVQVPTGSTGSTVSLGNHSHPGGSEAFPVGAVFIAVVSTDPATLLGYGTWSAFGAGRVLVGRDSGDTDFDTAEETGGAKTKAISAHAGTGVADHAALTHSGTAVGDHASHTHTYTEVVNHVHNQTRLPTATGGVTGFTVDTSMSGTPATTGVDTGNPTGGVATGTTAGPGATLTHSVTQPSQHAAQSHSVTQPSGHSDLNVVQPYIVVYMWKRTA